MRFDTRICTVEKNNIFTLSEILKIIYLVQISVLGKKKTYTEEIRVKIMI